MMQKLTYDPDTNDLDIMRDLRRKGLRLIRAIPGRAQPVRQTVVYVVEAPDE